MKVRGVSKYPLSHNTSAYSIWNVISFGVVHRTLIWNVTNLNHALPANYWFTVHKFKALIHHTGDI